MHKIRFGQSRKEMAMDDLFSQSGEKTFEMLGASLDELCESLTASNNLPVKSVIAMRNFGKGKNNHGDLITYTITIAEPPYPWTEEELDKIELRTLSPICRISASKLKKDKSFVELTIAEFMLKLVSIPVDARQLKSEDGYITYRIPLESAELIELVRRISQHKIDNFTTSEAPFGCCDLFEKCSDEKRCLHKNLLYATACGYRHHLEHGRIFYGKNKNV